ncbi:MAG: cupredoxin domain-containing protein [Candidatus Micrarchaeota archaeon]
MNNGIQIQKTTVYLFVGLFVAVLVGGYIVFGTASTPSKSQIGVEDNSIPQSPPDNGQATQQANDNQPQGDGQQQGNSQEVQEIYIKALPNGTYDKKEVRVKNGIPVRLHFTTQGNVGCGSYLVLYGLNKNTVSRNGQEGIIEFTPTQKGTYEYNCGMRMWQGGKLIVE